MTSTLAGLASAQQFGPWALDLDPAERLARTRSFRAIVRLLTGPRGGDLAALLHQAETDPAALVRAAEVLDRLAPLDLRRVLSTYAGLARPLPPARASKVGGLQPRARGHVWAQRHASVLWPRAASEVSGLGVRHPAR